MAKEATVQVGASVKNASADIIKAFPITDQEYRELDSKFGDLCNFQAWQLVRKNIYNNTGDDPDDIIQELKISMLQAGSYYKRQVYIEACFESLVDVVKELDHGSRMLLLRLRRLWKDRRRHGARKQKFGDHQERLLQGLVDHYVPCDVRPRKDKPLVIDGDVATYVKSCTWNQQRSMGRKITRERSIRVGQVSLNEYDFLCSDM